MRTLRGALLSLVLAQMLSSRWVQVAKAQTDEQRAGARQLATDGATAFNEGRWQDTVDLFTRAESLVHAPPHLLYQARAYEKLGQLVHARETYLKITRENLAANAPQVFQDAKVSAEQELKAVEPRVAALTVKIEGGEGAKDLAVVVDGVAVPSVLIGVSRPIDPGEHKIEGGAEGFRADPQTVKLGEGEKKAVVLKMIADPNAKSPVPSAQPDAVAPSTAPASSSAQSPAVDQGPREAPSDKSGLRIASYVAFGVGVVGLGAGTFFTLQSKSKRSDADHTFQQCGGASGCFNDNPLSSDVKALDDDARSALTLGIVGFIVGGVGIAAGTGLFIASSGGSEEKSAAIEPFIGLGSAGVHGKF